MCTTQKIGLMILAGVFFDFRLAETIQKHRTKTSANVDSIAIKILKHLDANVKQIEKNK